MDVKLVRALKRAARKRVRAKVKVPSDGTMVSLLYGDVFKDGDHWQVEYVHDTRMHPEPYISAWRWKGGFNGTRSYLAGTKTGKVIDGR